MAAGNREIPCRTFLLSSVSLPPGDFAVRPLQPAQAVAAHFGCDLLPCGCLVLIGAAFRRPYRPVDSGRQPQCRRFGVGEVGDSLENRLVRLPAGRFRAGRRRCSKDEGRRVGTLPVIYINLRCGLPCDAPCGTGIPVERSEVRKRRTSDRLFFLFYTVR